MRFNTMDFPATGYQIFQPRFSATTAVASMNASENPSYSGSGGDSIADRRPRLFTVKSSLIAFGILVFAVGMTAASIYMRRTPMEKTREFFGDDVILALQAGEQLRIILPPDSPMVDGDAPLAIIRDDGSQIANLSGSPGLGHFRHALLNERHYDWSSVTKGPADQLAVENPEYVYVEIEGRPANAKPVPMPIDIVPSRLVLELSEGWVSIDGGVSSVRMTERVRTGMRNFLDTRKDIGVEPSRL